MQVCDAPILHSLDEKSSRMDLSVEGFIMTIALHKQHCEHPSGYRDLWTFGGK